MLFNAEQGDGKCVNDPASGTATSPSLRGRRITRRPASWSPRSQASLLSGTARMHGRGHSSSAMTSGVPSSGASRVGNSIPHRDCKTRGGRAFCLVRLLIYNLKTVLIHTFIQTENEKEVLHNTRVGRYL